MSLLQQRTQRQGLLVSKIQESLRPSSILHLQDEVQDYGWGWGYSQLTWTPSKKKSGKQKTSSVSGLLQPSVDAR